MSETLGIFCKMFYDAFETLECGMGNFDLVHVTIIGPVEQRLNIRITITIERPSLTTV